MNNRHRAALTFATAFLAAGFASAARGQQPVEPLREPLAYDGELVEVTQQNTLRHRYHSYDLKEDTAFYLARAAKAGIKPGKIKILQVLIRQLDLVDDQNKVVAVCKIPESFVTEADEYAKTFSDFVFASSEGAMRVEFLPSVIIEKVQYPNGGLRGNWWLHPKSVEAQLEFLKTYKEGDADFMMFFLHVAKRTDNGQDIWPEFGGMAWGGEEIKGARLVTLNDHELARGIHEWQHHIFDTTIQETEGLTVSRAHGLFDAGYTGDSLKWGGQIGTLNVGPCLAYYRDLMRFYYTRDMWQRWRLRPPHNKPHEAFSGKPYAWADVRSDYWFKLPQLREKELQALTGLKTLRTLSGDSALTLDVAPGEDLPSPRASGEPKNDLALNNTVNFYSESAACIKAPTGRWLFVKPQLADLYVDVQSLRGGDRTPLPVYGYILEGCKALLAIRLPDDIPTPLNELSLFRPPRIAARAEGLLDPDDYRFRTDVTLSLASEIKGPAIRYTLDGSEPTEQSPLYEAPIKLSDSGTVKARLFGENAGPELTTWMRTFEFQPFTATAEGLVDGDGVSFDKRVTVRFKAHVSGGAIRYTLDGSAPAATSPAFDQPIVIEKNTTLLARHFGADGTPHGYTFTARYEEQNLALRKPVEISGNRNPNEKPEFAVDGTVDIGQYWGTIPAPQWLKVDLEKESLIDRIHVFPYWDGQRHYQYKVEVSTDGKEWSLVVDAGKNTETDTEKGRLHTFPPAKARFVRITMLSNSDNPAVHLVEMKVYGAR